MKKVTIILTLLSILHFDSVMGQDMHFTQFYSSPIYLNPAFAGANVCARASMTYRNQWPGVQKTYQSYLFSFDHDLQVFNLGAGLLLARDVAGSGDLSTTFIQPAISYGIKINRHVMMRLALQPGVILKNVDFNQLVFGDQIARGGAVPTIEEPTQSRAFADFSAGGIVYTDKYWGGISLFHLIKPNESLYGAGETKLPFKYSVHGGMKFQLDGSGLEDKDNTTLSPAVHYRGQADFDQFDIGLYFTRYILNLGIWYRGIPAIKAYEPGYANNDAMSLIIGLQTERFNVGYSFDITISKLSSLTNGAHEVTLAYQLCKLKRKKKKFGLMLPCPKF